METTTPTEIFRFYSVLTIRVSLPQKGHQRDTYEVFVSREA